MRKGEEISTVFIFFFGLFVCLFNVFLMFLMLWGGDDDDVVVVGVFVFSKKEFLGL